MLIIKLKTKQQSPVKRLSEAVTHFSQTVMGVLLNFTSSSSISHTQGHYPASSKNITCCSYHFPLERCSFSPAHFLLQRVWLVDIRKQERTGVPRLPSTSLYSEHLAAPSEGPGSKGQGTEPGARSKFGPSPKATASPSAPHRITGSWVCVPGRCCILNKHAVQAPWSAEDPIIGDIRKVSTGSEEEIMGFDW